MHRTWIISLLAAWWLTGPLAAAQATHPVPSAPADLLRILQEQDRKLQNLYVEGSFSQEKLEGGAWIKDGRGIDVRGWRSGTHRDRGRMDVTQWNDAIGFGGSYSVAFDGKNGRTLQDGRASIEAGPPQRLNDWLTEEALGAPYSLYFQRIGTERLLMDVLDPARQFPGVPIALVSEVWDDRPSLVVTAGPITNVTYNSKITYIWWLDPSRGYAMLRFQWLVNRGEGDEAAVEYRVTKLSEQPDGIWYPVEGYRYVGAAPAIRMHYQATKAIINDPSFDPAIFTLVFPTDAIVTDVARGRTYDPSAPSPMRRAIDTIDRFFLGMTQPQIIIWIIGIGAVLVLLALTALAQFRRRAR